MSNHHLKYAIALHTTSPHLGLAISNFQADTRSQTWELGRDTSSYLHQYLVNFIQPQTWQDLSFIAVAKGPGGFTGTRVGMVTARTFAQQLDIPVFAISTLSAIAQTVKSNYPNELLAVQMEARREEVFTALYQVSADGTEIKEKQADKIMKREIWQEFLKTLPTYQLVEAPDNLGITVSGVLQLAYQQWKQGLSPHWSEALPFYGQHPIR